ncbi:MAG: DJ-1/PfpI family protein [Gammaproteobacteria bacterium]|nr:DJ-1/PfpI family protein [Gammaproteobacteria bacterium]
MASVLIPLAQGCEELEAVTIIDLLRRAGITVTTASLDPDKLVVASRGTKLVADKTLADIGDQLFDMLVLPGGLPGSDYLRDDPKVQACIKAHFKAKRYVAAICAAPRALAAAGVLDGCNATSYPGTLDKMTNVPGMRYVEQDVVIDGTIITSRGPGTAMDFALTLIEVLDSKIKRLAVEGPLLRPKKETPQ